MSKTRRLVICAILTSLALALSYTEKFIPLHLMVPLPGIKLGLANIATIVALYLLDKKSCFAIVLLRCFLGSVFGGGVTGLLFSLSGGVLSLIVMSGAKKLPFLSVFGVSILGAASHNIGQICAAMPLLHSVYIAAYLPYLLIAALITGFATGSVGSGILKILFKLDFRRTHFPNSGNE